MALLGQFAPDSSHNESDGTTSRILSFFLGDELSRIHESDHGYDQPFPRRKPSPSYGGVQYCRMRSGTERVLSLEEKKRI